MLIDSSPVLTSEQYILACILRGDSGRDYIAEAQSRGLTPEMFTGTAWGELFRTAAQLHDDGLSAHDAELVIGKTVDRAGIGAEEMRRAASDCFISVDPSDVNYIAHVDTLVNDFYQRRGIYAAMERCQMEGMSALEATIEAQHFIERYHTAAGGDGLPDFVDLSTVTGDNLPPLAPELIHGILRRGHIMEYTGASKSGKSFACINLAVAVATGGIWLGVHRCERGNVLYVNCEIQDTSVYHRYQNIINARGEHPGAGVVQIWNLRGKVFDMETVTRGIISRCRASGIQYSLVLIDPIYKLFSGDENSAGDTGRFFAALDRIAEATGAAVCIAHHHSKGAQEGKSAMDRGSGSGVFARAPDTLVDALEIETTPEALEALQTETGRECSGAVALRISYTLREFAPRGDDYVIYDYPIYHADTSGTLADARSMAAVRQADVRRRNARSGVDWQMVIDGTYRHLKRTGNLGNGYGVEVAAMLSGIYESVGQRRSDEYTAKKIRAAGYRVKAGHIYSAEDYDLRF